MGKVGSMPTITIEMNYMPRIQEGLFELLRFRTDLLDMFGTLLIVEKRRLMQRFRQEIDELETFARSTFPAPHYQESDPFASHDEMDLVILVFQGELAQHRNDRFDALITEEILAQTCCGFEIPLDSPIEELMLDALRDFTELGTGHLVGSAGIGLAFRDLVISHRPMSHKELNALMDIADFGQPTTHNLVDFGSELLEVKTFLRRPEDEGPAYRQFDTGYRPRGRGRNRAPERHARPLKGRK